MGTILYFVLSIYANHLLYARDIVGVAELKEVPSIGTDNEKSARMSNELLIAFNPIGEIHGGYTRNDYSIRGP